MVAFQAIAPILLYASPTHQTLDAMFIVRHNTPTTAEGEIMSIWHEVSIEEEVDLITWRSMMRDAIADLCGIALAFAIVAGWILL